MTLVTKRNITIIYALLLTCGAIACSSDNGNVQADSGDNDSQTALDSVFESSIETGSDAPDPLLDSGGDTQPEDTSLQDSNEQDTQEKDTELHDTTTDQGSADGSGSCTPVDESPGKTPEGYPLDGWNWTRHGVIFEPSEPEKLKGLASPTAVVKDDAVHLWFLQSVGSETKVFHAQSKDGKTFGATAVTAGLLRDSDNMVYMSVLASAGQYRMWLGNGWFYHARSTDGITWTREPEPVLKPSGGTGFDSLSLTYPNVIPDGTGFIMYYTGFDGKDAAIGRATSADGLSFTSESTAILKKNPGFDNAAAAQACAYQSGEITYLWYSGYDTSKTTPGPYRIGLAKGTAKGTMERKGVSIDLQPSGKEAYTTRSPAVVRFNDTWWMYYVVLGDDNVYRLAAASSENCLE